MKSKSRYRGRQAKPFDLSSLVELEDVDVKKDLPILQSVLDTEEVHLCNLDKLQFEVERLIGNTHHLSLHLTCTAKGNPTIEHPCTFASQDGNDEKSLFVKANPEKPLTLIFSQKRPIKLEKGKTPPVQKNGLINGNGPIDNSSSNWTNGHRASRQNSKKRKLGLTTNGEDCDIAHGHQDPKILYAIPNKFWALMEPYCAEITEDQSKTLEDLIKVYDDDASYYRIPPLGTDHHLRGCGEVKHELPVENGNGAHRPSHPKTNRSDSVSTLKKITADIRQPMSESSAVYSLTQSLVSSLVEENVTHVLAGRVQEQFTEHEECSINELATQPPKQLAKQLHVSNSYKLEKSIRAGLHASASLAHPISPGRVFALTQEEDEDCEDEKPSRWGDLLSESTDHPEDEVLARLRQRQSELRLVSEANLVTLRRLEHTTRLDLQRQELTRRLAVADADVIEAFNKLESYRPNRKIPLKRDRETAWKCLKERKKIIKELESFDAKL